MAVHLIDMQYDASNQLSRDQSNLVILEFEPDEGDYLVVREMYSIDRSLAAPVLPKYTGRTFTYRIMSIIEMTDNDAEEQYGVLLSPATIDELVAVDDLPQLPADPRVWIANYTTPEFDRRWSGDTNIITVPGTTASVGDLVRIYEIGGDRLILGVITEGMSRSSFINQSVRYRETSKIMNRVTDQVAEAAEPKTYPQNMASTTFARLWLVEEPVVKVDIERKPGDFVTVDERDIQRDHTKTGRYFTGEIAELQDGGTFYREATLKNVRYFDDFGRTPYFRQDKRPFDSMSSVRLAWVDPIDLQVGSNIAFYYRDGEDLSVILSEVTGVNQAITRTRVTLGGTVGYGPIKPFLDHVTANSDKPGFTRHFVKYMRRNAFSQFYHADRPLRVPPADNPKIGERITVHEIDDFGGLTGRWFTGKISNVRSAIFDRYPTFSVRLNDIRHNDDMLEAYPSYSAPLDPGIFKPGNATVNVSVDNVNALNKELDALGDTLDDLVNTLAEPTDTLDSAMRKLVDATHEALVRFNAAISETSPVSRLGSAIVREQTNAELPRDKCENLPDYVEVPLNGWLTLVISTNAHDTGVDFTTELILSDERRDDNDRQVVPVWYRDNLVAALDDLVEQLSNLVEELTDQTELSVDCGTAEETIELTIDIDAGTVEVTSQSREDGELQNESSYTGDLWTALAAATSMSRDDIKAAYYAAMYGQSRYQSLRDSLRAAGFSGLYNPTGQFEQVRVLDPVKPESKVVGYVETGPVALDWLKTSDRRISKAIGVADTFDRIVRQEATRRAEQTERLLHEAVANGATELVIENGDGTSKKFDIVGGLVRLYSDLVKQYKQTTGREPFGECSIGFHEPRGMCLDAGVPTDNAEPDARAVTRGWREQKVDELKVALAKARFILDITPLCIWLNSKCEEKNSNKPDSYRSLNVPVHNCSDTCGCSYCTNTRAYTEVMNAASRVDFLVNTVAGQEFVDMIEAIYNQDIPPAAPFGSAATDQYNRLSSLYDAIEAAPFISWLQTSKYRSVIRRVLEADNAGDMVKISYPSKQQFLEGCCCPVCQNGQALDRIMEAIENVAELDDTSFGNCLVSSIGEDYAKNYYTTPSGPAEKPLS